MNSKHIETPSIYTVTLLYITGMNTTLKRWSQDGWFHSFEKAEQARLNNQCDMFECGWFNHVVICEEKEGIYPQTKNQWWYKAIWNKRKDTYKIVPLKEKPKAVRHLVF